MRIYAVADIHGRPKKVAAMQRQIDAHRPDLVVVAGDITRRRHPHQTLEALSQLGLPVYWVRGNSDGRRLSSIAARYPNLHDLHLHRTRAATIDLMGIGGCLPLPFASRLAWQEKMLAAQAAALIQSDAVLVVHPPPHGTCDRVLGRFHGGSRAVRNLVQACRPAAVLCGHIHEQAGMERMGNTVVVNCALSNGCKGALIRIEKGVPPACTMLA